MNERLIITVPASFLLWATALLLFSFSLNREVDRPLTGRDTVTVRVVTLSHPVAPETPPAAPSPRHEVKPMKKTPAAAPVPVQHLSEEKTDSHAAVVTYQPLPKIPDDLRTEAFRTVAVARFHVAADGGATVELVTPSQNPRLNRLLMDALKTWKFSSATESGRPVASTFTIRVHFAVE